MQDFRAMVREFTIRKLANDLYSNVETSCEDRALLDWLTAESVVDKIHWLSVMPPLFSSLLAREADPEAFTARREVKIDPNNVNYETFARLCGRNVWDFFYQPAKSMLPKEYTYIRFH